MRGVLLLAASLALLPPAFAQEPTTESSERHVELHGFVLGLLSGRTTGARRPEGGDLVLGEERLRLELSGTAPSGEGLFLVKGDVAHDALTQSVDLDLREVYVGWASGRFDLRLGRQIVTWGVGDLFFINDVFPKDWGSFFGGRPLEYLKLGVDGLRARYSSSGLSADFLLLPTFTPDAMPSADRFFYFDPFAGVPGQREVRPPARYGNTELALRLSRRLGEVDVSLYAYRGFFRTPSVRLDDDRAPTTVTRFYPKLAAFGMSAQRALAGGVVSLEAGYYDSREDPTGADPWLPNSQWRFLASYQLQTWQDGTLGLQLYSEKTEDFDAYRRTLPPGAPAQKRWRNVASARLTQFLAYQTWRLSLFAAYSPSDDDYLLQPEVAYKLSDELSAAVGTNIFGGTRETTFFGQLAANDNLYLAARFDF